MRNFRTTFFSLIIFILLLSGCQGVQSGSLVEVAETSVPAATNTPYSVVPEVTPLPSPTATPPCTDRQGSIKSGQILSTKLDKPMNYTVYLPPCYFHDTAERYPVIYLLHGQANSEFEWIQLGITNAADDLITAGLVEPFIMVFPFDHSFKQPDQYGFADVFVGMLIPEIDRLYRTLDDGAHRAIGGISRGGAWAFHLGANYPKLFSAVAGHSPTIFFSDGNSLPKKFLALPENDLPRLWIDLGDSDPGLKLMTEFHDLLTDNYIPHEWHVNKGYHEEKYWAAHLREYLLWYNTDW